jgi:hypothetical protein
VDIELDPPHGITGFPLGMPAEEVKSAAARLGRTKVSNEGSTAPFRPMKVLALHEQFEIVFHLPGSRELKAAEVWIPQDGPEDITVRFRGLDVFRTPARELLDTIGGMDLAVLEPDGLHPVVPHLSLGFTRVAGHDVPLDTDGEPLYFQAVLVGGTDYYDYRLPQPPDPS